MANNEIIGKIEGVSSKAGDNWVRWEFVIGGKKYSTFDKVIGEKFKIGDNVKMIGELDAGGKYWNMGSMEYFDGEVEVVKPMGNSTNTKEEYHLTPEKCRIAALECAIQLKQSPNFNHINVLEEAKVLLKFIKGKE